MDSYIQQAMRTVNGPMLCAIEVTYSRAHHADVCANLLLQTADISFMSTSGPINRF